MIVRKIAMAMITMMMGDDNKKKDINDGDDYSDDTRYVHALMQCWGSWRHCWSKIPS